MPDEPHKKTDDEYREELSPELYDVARGKGTEAPFTGRYYDSKERGMYHCAVCGAELFSSDTKFDSGTGWPSFTDPADQKNIELREDRSHGMVRTEVLCRRCGSHLGHVFDDGPRSGDTPPGRRSTRYCINSVCLSLKKKDPA